MNEFVFETQGTNTYLVYAISPEDVIDSMSLGMLTNNKISGLASTLFTQMDATKYIKYNVSAKISVRQFFSGAVNKKRMLGVFKGIVNALLSAEDYMINEDTIILDLDYIFADVSTCETVLICLPVQGLAEHHDLGAFFKGIMFSTQFDQTENCDYVARIINYLNSTPMFSLADFKALLDSIENANAVSAPKAQPTTQAATQPVAQPKVEQPQVQPVVNNPAPIQHPVTKAPATPPTPATPAHQQVKPVEAPAKTQPAAPEKKISMLGLLMHYSKENAELYKAQQAAKKNAPAQAKPVQPQKKAPQTSFAVPGNNAASFAIPGQSAQPIATPAKTAPVQSAPAQPIAPAQVQTAPVQQPVYVPTQAPQGQAANFGETTVLGGGAVGETTVLGAGAAPVKNDPHLIRSKNNEKIPLNKPVFRIGKERSYVDYFISDNTAISRGHANIVDHNGEFFVVDTNSTNHTYVNGAMIQSGVETKLAHGDKVRLANEDFEFRMY